MTERILRKIICVLGSLLTTTTNYSYVTNLLTTNTQLTTYNYNKPTKNLINHLSLGDVLNG